MTSIFRVEFRKRKSSSCGDQYCRCRVEELGLVKDTHTQGWDVCFVVLVFCCPTDFSIVNCVKKHLFSVYVCIYAHILSQSDGLNRQKNVESSFLHSCTCLDADRQVSHTNPAFSSDPIPHVHFSFILPSLTDYSEITAVSSLSQALVKSTRDVLGRFYLMQ